MTRLALAVSLALMAVATDLHAQADATALVPGTRVRVHQGAQSMTGSLLYMDSTSLALVTGRADTVTTPLALITGIDVSRGTKSRAGRGALIGVGVGAASGIIVGIAASGSDDGDFFDFSSGAWATGIGLTGAVLGAGIGAIIGATQHGDRWQPAVLPTVSVQSVGTDDRRIAVGVRIPF